jgi:hypothetical protein
VEKKKKRRKGKKKKEKRKKGNPNIEDEGGPWMQPL